MQNIYNRIILAALIIPLFLATGCKSDDAELFDKTFDIPQTITMHPGDEIDFINYFKEKDAIVYPAVAFDWTLTSENSSIVKVDNDGTLIAVSYGTTDVLVKNSEEDVLRTVKVTVEPFYRLVDLPSVLNLKYGESYPLLAPGQDVDWNRLYHELEVTVSPWHTYELPITREGVLKPLSIGSYVLTIRYKLLTDPTYVINVNVAPNYEIDIPLGGSVAVSDIVKDSEPTTGYTSSNRDAVVEANGIIYGYEPGTYNLTTDNTMIVINVGEYKGGNFNLPSLPSSISLYHIKKWDTMSNYKLVSEGYGDLDGERYYILKYAPYGDCQSISLYYANNEETATNKLLFGVITTGMSSTDSLAMMLRYGGRRYPNGDYTIKYFLSMGDYYMPLQSNDWSQIKVSTTYPR